MKKISVIIPVFNTEKYLKICLDSIINQTLSDIEIICINDCSTDNSLNILDNYAKNNENIKIIDLKENKGASFARNIGITKSNGEYIGFVDSDDFVEADFFEKLYKKALETNADIVKGNYRYNNNNYINYSLNDRIKDNKTNFSFDYCSAIFKRELIVQNNIKFPENYQDMEDPYFAFLASVKANKVEIVKDAIINIVKREGSLTYGEPTMEKIEKKYKGLTNLIEVINDNFKSIEPESYAFNTAFWLFNCICPLFNTENIQLKKFITEKAFEVLALIKTEYQELLRTQLNEFDEKIACFLFEKNERGLIYYSTNKTDVIPVFLSSDENYAPFVATTIASVCYSTKSFVCFYVLDGGITNFSKRQIRKLENKFDNLSIEFIEIDTEKEFADIEYSNSCPHVSISTYNRFLIPQLKPFIKKAIYLDVDLIVLDDIKYLFDIDLEEYSLAAASENIGIVNLQEYHIRMNLENEHKYFNAGVLLINCDKWREDNIAQKCLNIEKECRNILKHADQDILNIYYNNNYKNLCAKFNFMTNDCENNIIKDTIIRHFNCKEKPWNSYLYQDKPIKNFQDFWFFASLTEFYEGLKMSFQYHLLKANSLNQNCNKDNDTKDVPKYPIINNIRMRVIKDLKDNKHTERKN